MNLKTDPNRESLDIRTGIFVRARSEAENKVISADIARLDKESLLAWLKSRDGDNPWAEDVVGILLGHGNLHS